MFQDARSLVVIDVEATCDDRGSVPRPETEIIEVGAVIVDAATLGPVDELQSFVRPVRHPVLTPFCTRLTTIRQSDVDGAPGFPEVFAALTEWIGRHPGPAVFCSWGDYDRKQFAQDCAFHGIANALPERHFNVKRAFSERVGAPRGLGMGQALGRMGMPLHGTHHRALDDTRNIARLLPFALRRDG